MKNMVETGLYGMEIKRVCFFSKKVDIFC